MILALGGRFAALRRRLVVRLGVAMGVLMALCGLAFVLLGRSEVEHSRRILEAQRATQQRMLENTVALRAETMRTFVADYSLWNDMADFARRPNPTWATVNLESSVANFKLSRIWVYDASGRLRYQTLGGSRAEEPVDVARLFSGEPFAHFFRTTNGALVEYRAAKIQREDDVDRTSPALGYIVAARLWDDGYVSGFEPLLGGAVAIRHTGEPCEASVPSTIATELTLADAGEGAAATLCSTVPNPIALRMAGFRQDLISYMIVFALLLLILLAVTLRALVTRPLGIIHAAIGRGDSEELRALRRSSTELAALAEIIIEHQASVEERQRLQAQVYQAGKFASLGVLGAGVAHELNNPLTVVLGYGELLASDDLGGLTAEEAKEAAAAIVSQGERMKTMINYIREFAREESSPERRMGSMNDVVARASAGLSGDIARSGIALTVDLDEALPAVSCDPTRLESAVRNLLDNARDAFDGTRAEEPRNITIRTERAADPERVCLVIEDNGHGVPADARDRIFEPFFTTKPVGKGTGLGLTIVYAIVRQHGGTIEHESAVTHGAKFTMTLPAAAPTMGRPSSASG